MKELISDIAYDKINLGQALTRAKLIAYQIDNSTLKKWLSNELNGYDYDDQSSPDYRSIYSEIILYVEYPMWKSQTITVTSPTDADKQTSDLIYLHKVNESIFAIESMIESIEGNLAQIHLPASFVQIVGKLYQKDITKHNGSIIEGKRKVSKIQLQNIIDQTKQKLLEILLEIDNKFPELKTSFKNTETDKAIVQNIVTNNIYGNNNATQTAAGEYNTLGNITISINEEVQKKLRSLGIQEEDIEELIKIDTKYPEKSENRKNSILKWVGNVTASLTTAGIQENIPEIIEYIGNLF